jgi:hypothetical protein
MPHGKNINSKKQVKPGQKRGPAGGKKTGKAKVKKGKY